jgi:chromosome partitioning protein
VILSLVNNKGGVGKTTSAVNLVAGLARSSAPVLLVDLDSQGSASLSLGIERGDAGPSVASVLFDGMPVEEAARPTSIEGVNVLAADAALASGDLRLADVVGREHRLRDVLAPVRARYAYIVVDCPPSLSLLPINALVAADAYIAPVVPQYLALEGLANLMTAVDRLGRTIGTTGPLLGILLTMADYRLNATREIVKMIRMRHQALVFETEVRTNVRLAEAPSFHRSIFDYDRRSVGAAAYDALTAEVEARCRRLGAARGRVADD